MNKIIEYLLRYGLIIFLLFEPVAVMAANWVLIAATEDVEVEIDSQSVRPNKGAWFKYIQTPPSKEACTYASKEVAYSKMYIEAKCNDFTTRTKQEIAYAEDGSVLNECGFNNPKQEFREYAPETFGEVFFYAICDPKARVKSRFAEYIRKDKEKKQDQAKPYGAECRVSAECRGTLLCGKVDDTRMRCMFPNDVMNK